MINVLMTGAGAPGGPGIIKCLLKDKNIRLVVCDANKDSSGRFLNKKFERLPLAEDKNFINEILRICEHYSIDVIFPLVTKELFKLSKERIKFNKRGIKIIVSDYKELLIANDKSALYKHLKKHKILTPKFKVAQTFKDVIKAFRYFGFPKNPVCVKPSISNGSRGVRIIDDSVDEFDLLFNHKPSSLYMSFSKLKKILKNNNFPELLISEFLPHEEYTIDTIVSKGKVILVLPRKRTQISGGISVAGYFEENLEIIAYCKQIISSLNLSGPIGLQVKKSNEGVFKILEINPRIQGTSVSALGAGVNLPLIAVYNALNIKFNIPTINWKTKFVRYFNEVYYK